MILKRREVNGYIRDEEVKNIYYVVGLNENT